MPGLILAKFGSYLKYYHEIKFFPRFAYVLKYGAVSDEVSRAKAVSIRKIAGSDFGLSITGIAGPEGGTEDKPVGTIYVGLASAHSAQARLFQLGRERQVNRARSSYAALEMLRREILDIK